MTDVRKNSDLRWFRPDGETQVTIEFVPQVMEEIADVVRSIPQERVEQRTVEQIVHVPRTTGRGRNSGSLEVYRRPNRRCASGDAMTSTDNPDSSEDVKKFHKCSLLLSGRRVGCNIATSANVMKRTHLLFDEGDTSAMSEV